MREILFRGKSSHNGKWVEGEWVEGYLGIEVGKIPYIQWLEYDDDYHEDVVEECAVDPDTVGQYIGLTDKNGKKIFEGDILSGQLDDLFPTEESIYEVVWHDYGWHIRNNSGIDTADKEWIRQYFKVIGNIYDNPELLER